LDKEYWKKLYKDDWPAGSRRVKKIGELLESCGFNVEPYGFMPDSSEYSKESPKEKGIPDLKISLSKLDVLLEVTGTIRSRGIDDVWIRDDKFEYAENHPDQDCWVGHILEDSNLIRFMKLENKTKYPLREIQLKVMEKYRVVPDGDSVLKTPEEFKSYLKSK